MTWMQILLLACNCYVTFQQITFTYLSLSFLIQKWEYLSHKTVSKFKQNHGFEFLAMSLEYNRCLVKSSNVL